MSTKEFSNQDLHFHVYWFLLKHGYVSTAEAFKQDAKKHLKSWLKANKRVKDLQAALKEFLGKPLLEATTAAAIIATASTTAEGKAANESVLNNAKYVGVKAPPNFVRAVGVDPVATVQLGTKRTFESNSEDSESDSDTAPSKPSVSNISATHRDIASQSHASPCKDENDFAKSNKIKSKKSLKDKPVGKATILHVPTANTAIPANTAATKIPFKRVDPALVEFQDERLKTNRFLDKGGAAGSYGEKAYFDLAPTRGKGFRQEKNKKKRGSYHGGKIDDNTVHSIKFEDSD